MRRLFVEDLSEVEASGALPANAKKHVKVLRLQAGTLVELFDGTKVAQATLGFDGAVTLEEVRNAEDRSLPLTLLCALPKGPRAEQIVRMSTELGVREIAFVLSERTIARPDERRAKKRIERLQKIAQEAARQCERDVPPVVHPILPLKEWLLRQEGTERYFAYARADEAEAPIGPAPSSVAIGPEGGFSESEVRRFEEAGWKALRLGVNVLRVETAAVCAVARFFRP